MNFRPYINLWVNYAWTKLYDQFYPVLCVVLYLLVSHIFVFNQPLDSLFLLAVGTGFVLLGLSLFLESVNLCVMPLAEMAGFHLRKTLPLFLVFFIALALGAIATIAEPAISVFKQTQEAFSDTSTSLVALIIGDHSNLIAIAISVGVGMATAIGILKSAAQWPLKNVLFVLILIALGLSVFAFLNEETRGLSSLAWDTGGVATGPITVSFMIAFGLGINRGNPNQGSGLGIVSIATLMPVIFTLIFTLCFYYLHKAGLIDSQQATGLLTNQESVSHLLRPQGSAFFISELKRALTAALPIVLFLMVILLLLIRKKPPFLDEKILGLVFLIFGSMAFTTGIERGITPLGENIGAATINLIKPKEKDLSASMLIHNFDLKSVQKGYDTDGNPIEFFYFVDKKAKNKVRMAEFDSTYYNAEKRTFLYIPKAQKTLFSNPHNKLQGYLIILLFSLILGIVITAVEPTLITFAHTIEDASVGTITASSLIRFVAVSSGLGLALGVLRLVFQIPFAPLICGLYLIVLILMSLSKDEVVEVAWDAAGSTTGPITIPLVIALQIGLGKVIGGSDIFGVIALTTVVPAIMMLVRGQYLQRKEEIRLKESLSV